MTIEQTPYASREVAVVFRMFPERVRAGLKFLRSIIFDAADSIEDQGEVTESLKWGEPSYSRNSGTPIRLGWKGKEPENIYMFFHCQSKLVETFRQVYPHTFRFQGNRAICFRLDDEIPVKEVLHCCALANTYHNVKHLPLLGAG